MSSFNLRKNVTVAAAQAADSDVPPEKILRIFFTKKKTCKRTTKNYKQLSRHLEDKNTRLPKKDLKQISTVNTQLFSLLSPTLDDAFKEFYSFFSAA